MHTGGVDVMATLLSPVPLYAAGWLVGDMLLSFNFVVLKVNFN